MATGLPENMPLYSLLTALAAAFVGLCEDHDIDPDGAMAQIANMLDRDPAMLGSRESITPGMLHLYS